MEGFERADMLDISWAWPFVLTTLGQFEYVGKRNISARSQRLVAIICVIQMDELFEEATVAFTDTCYGATLPWRLIDSAAGRAAAPSDRAACGRTHTPRGRCSRAPPAAVDRWHGARRPPPRLA